MTFTVYYGQWGIRVLLSKITSSRNVWTMHFLLWDVKIEYKETKKSHEPYPQNWWFFNTGGILDTSCEKKLRIKIKRIFPSRKK